MKIRITFRFDHLSIIALALVFVLASSFSTVYLLLNQHSAAASGTQLSQTSSQSMRRYYLTSFQYTGGNADAACTSGYHFASIWEILDVSNLKYNTSIGRMNDDSGLGPPVDIGWVRTGYDESTSGQPGELNCLGWSSSENKHFGTIATLNFDLSSGAVLDTWITAGNRCNNAWPVWCVEDEIGEEVYLPLVYNNYP